MPDTTALLGGGGFIGRHLAAALVAAGHRVRIYSRHFTHRLPGVEYHQGLIEDQEAVGQWVEGADQLLYLAHNTSLTPFRDHDRFALVGNLEPFVSTLHTAHAAGVRRVLLVSSGGAIYGPTGREAVPEEHPPRPASAYGLAKLAMEHYLRMFGAQHEVAHLTIRPSNAYGPGQAGGREQGFIGVALRNILLGRPVEIWGDTTITKDYVYAPDLAEAVVRLLHCGFDQQTYNVCSGTSVSLGEILDLIRRIVDRPFDLRVLPPRGNDVRQVHLDRSRLSQRTGWRPATSLAEGIAATWAWMSSPAMQTMLSGVLPVEPLPLRPSS